MGVGPHDGYLLRLFGMELRKAFGHTAYQVGSSLTQKGGWRDVDVRLLLPDEEFGCYFDPASTGNARPRLTSWNLAWTMFGRQATGLPIDFQFQAVTAANSEFDGPRSALIILSEEVPNAA